MEDADAVPAANQTGLTNVPWHIFLESHFQNEAKLDEFRQHAINIDMQVNRNAENIEALKVIIYEEWQKLIEENKALKAEVALLKGEKVTLELEPGSNESTGEEEDQNSTSASVETSDSSVAEKVKGGPKESNKAKVTSVWNHRLRPRRLKTKSSM